MHFDPKFLRRKPFFPLFLKIMGIVPLLTVFNRFDLQQNVHIINFFEPLQQFLFFGGCLHHIVDLHKFTKNSGKWFFYSEPSQI